MKERSCKREGGGISYLLRQGVTLISHFSSTLRALDQRDITLLRYPTRKADFLAHWPEELRGEGKHDSCASLKSLRGLHSNCNPLPEVLGYHFFPIARFISR